jgi:hypothetical protein
VERDGKGKEEGEGFAVALLLEQNLKLRKEFLY